MSHGNFFSIYNDTSDKIMTHVREESGISKPHTQADFPKFSWYLRRIAFHTLFDCDMKTASGAVQMQASDTVSPAVMCLACL